MSIKLMMQVLFMWNDFYTTLAEDASIQKQVQALSSSLFVSYISCIMAPKRKSTLSRNPLRSEASSSSSPSEPTPSHIQFRDEKAKLDFLENFS